MFSLVSMPFTTVIMATEMPAAIRPYSMAVAPFSSLRNALNYGLSLRAAYFRHHLAVIEHRD